MVTIKNRKMSIMMKRKNKRKKLSSQRREVVIKPVHKLLQTNEQNNYLNQKDNRRQREELKSLQNLRQKLVNHKNNLLIPENNLKINRKRNHLLDHYFSKKAKSQLKNRSKNIMTVKHETKKTPMYSHQHHGSEIKSLS